MHKSAINGLILAGAEPVFLSPLYDAEWDICHGTSLEDDASGLEGALKEHAATVAAVLLVSPTYHGAMMDIQRASAICKRYGALLIVDEAHGAHLSFLESSGDSRSKGALADGADIVIQSTHKTLTSLSQSAMIHASPSVDDMLIELIGSASQLIQSSSPNYVLLASLDGARWQLGSSQGQGRVALHHAQALARQAREGLRKETPGVDVLGCHPSNSPAVSSGAFVDLDPLRLTVCLPPSLGISGYEADEVLIEEYGVYAEYPAARTLTFAIGPGNSEDDVEKLIAAFRGLTSSASPSRSSFSAAAASSSFPGRTRLCSPRDAYFSPSEVLPTDHVAAIVGRASAETVCPYPPGIPILLPGEVITTDVLDYLKGVLAAGGSVTGCTDPTLRNLRVLCL